MMKPFILFLAFFLVFCGISMAQEPAENNSLLYITQYHLAADNSAVYGLFDLGSKPSVRLLYPTPNGGKLKLQLHGRQYVSPLDTPFSLTASYEDVTGRVFGQSPKVVFETSKQPMTPRWFSGLENVAGLYGSKVVELTVPAGTTTVNLVGDDESTSVSPNQLVGYISHIELPTGK